MMNMKVNGLSVYLYGNQKNQPVIFVHGFPFDHTMWKEQIDELKDKYYCIAYDVRGLGKSVVRDGQFTMEMYVDDLFNIIDKLKLKKPYVCGLSMGGYITLRAVERDQNKFKGLILCDTRSDADNDEGKLKRANVIKQINEDGVEKFVKGFVSGLFADETKDENPDLYISVIKRCQKSTAVGVKGALLAIMSRTETTNYLSQIYIPSLVLCGSFDKLTPPNVMRIIAEKIDNSEFAVIPRAGHLAPLENPDCVNDMIMKFLG
jgi:3-oxoadipate enol-lactonase